MKSEKNTSPFNPLGKRWYNDACGTALALDFVGERWSLLILRELMLGPRRFSDLKSDLNGISANILTMRLDRLQSLGILLRRPLGPPANVQAYELTSWGYEAEPIFQTMGRWALRSPLHDPTLPLTPVSAMLSLRTMLTPGHKAPPMTLGFRFGHDTFTGTIGEQGLHIERGSPKTPDVEFDTDTTSFAKAIYGKYALEGLEEKGLLKVTGDRVLAQAFVDCFQLPERIGKSHQASP